MTRASLGKLFPVSAPVPMALLPARVWSQEQWERIERGYRARGMDEKWDVFTEGQVAFPAPQLDWKRDIRGLVLPG